MVLSGEHSVLRGGAAICMPYEEMGLKFQFQPEKGKGLRVLPSPWGEALLKLLKRSGLEKIPGGLVQVGSTIPTQAGLGSSAALSVAVVRWLSGEGLAPELQWSRARDLEHEFHGVSSGMDVAAVIAKGPICFQKGVATPIRAKKGKFKISLHDSGVRSSTVEMVKRVQSHPQTPKIDEVMGDASDQIMGALKAGDALALAEGVHLARSCFKSWDLIPPEVAKLERSLKRKGSLATKPTGAGGGGFVLSIDPV